MNRLNIFAKGNVDVHDSLIYSRVNGRIEWNGLNTLLAENHPDHVARVRHEPSIGWGGTGFEPGKIPPEIARRQLNLGAFNLDVQFRSKLFEHGADVMVLSIQADVTNRLWRHRRDGYSFMGTKDEDWSREDMEWVREEFELLELPSPKESMDRLGRLVETIRTKSQPTILVYNMSAVIPGERITSYRGLADALSTRIRAFNVALIDASAALDISIVDVDQVIARAGADQLKLDYLHYSPLGYRLIAAEVERILETHGHLDS